MGAKTPICLSGKGKRVYQAILWLIEVLMGGGVILIERKDMVRR